MLTIKNAQAAAKAGCEFAIITTAGIYYVSDFDYPEEVAKFIQDVGTLTVDLVEDGVVTMRCWRAHINPRQVVAIVTIRNAGTEESS